MLLELMFLTVTPLFFVAAFWCAYEAGEASVTGDLRQEGRLVLAASILMVTSLAVPTFIIF